MKLLVVTQKIDANDPVLGFFVRWIEALSEKYEKVSVIALEVGTYELPSNVSVYSLGKESGKRSLVDYALSFLGHVWTLRKDYDTVFVHMNQEYVLLAGLLWRSLGKRIYMWRNHYAGSWLTDIAASLCRNVFYTSKRSYTARYTHAVQMPVGVDTERFHPVSGIARERNLVLFLSRIAPSKRPEMLIDALTILKQKGIPFQATFVGAPLPQDVGYFETLKKSASGLSVAFSGAVPNRETPPLYSKYGVFVNTSPSGMFDKTLFEAAACGATVLASSDDFKELAGEESHFSDAPSLAKRIEESFFRNAHSVPAYVKSHSLQALVGELSSRLSS